MIQHSRGRYVSARTRPSHQPTNGVWNARLRAKNTLHVGERTRHLPSIRVPGPQVKYDTKTRSIHLRLWDEQQRGSVADVGDFRGSGLPRSEASSRPLLRDRAPVR